MEKNGLIESTAALKLLSFLSNEPGMFFTPAEAVKKAKMSRRSFYFAIKELISEGYAVAETKGNYSQYAADYKNPFVKQYKVLRNIASINGLLRELGAVSVKITLYGSAARGEDSVESDLDLFVVTQDQEAAKAILNKHKNGRKLQVIIKTPSEIPDFSDKEKIFFAEVQKGIVLMERL